MVTINSLDEVTRISELTELAMDDNPSIATTARITKDLFPIVEKVFDREFERNPSLAINGISNFIQGLLINKVILDNYCGHPECALTKIKEIKRLFVNHFDSTIEKLPEILNATTEE